MDTFKQRVLAVCGTLALALTFFAQAALVTAQDAPRTNADTSNSTANNVTRQVDAATRVVQQMNADPALKAVLQQASGVFVIPNYKRVAFVLGVRGGTGLLMVRHGDKWSDPAFYRVGGIGAGLQAGVQAGALTLVLNNDKAIQHFMQNNNFSLNADAGLTIVNWSAAAQGSSVRGDVTAWSDTAGLFGGVALDVADIRFNRDATAAYYGKQVALNDVLGGSVQAPSQSTQLKQALAGMGSMGDTSSTGSSGSKSSTRSGDGSSDKSGNKK